MCTGVPAFALPNWASAGGPVVMSPTATVGVGDAVHRWSLTDVRASTSSAALQPLGGMTKPEVRAHAERLGLATSSKPESQEICFIPDDDHTRFVREHANDPDASGDIVNEDGEVLGQHDGYFRYTIGQRRGLGVAAGYPLYVLKIDALQRRVVVGPGERLLEQGLIASGMNWFRRPAEGEAICARIRHNGGLIPAEVEGDDPITVRFQAPTRSGP